MKRICFRLPIPEIFQAAQYLQSSVVFHLAGEYEKANECIVSADMPII
jgi:hypothetical protein